MPSKDDYKSLQQNRFKTLVNKGLNETVLRASDAKTRTFSTLKLVFHQVSTKARHDKPQMSPSGKRNWFAERSFSVKMYLETNLLSCNKLLSTHSAYVFRVALHL